MGYTHYYEQSRKMTEPEFEGFKQDVSLLLAALRETPTVGQFEQRFGEVASLGWKPEDPLAVEAEATGGGIVEPGRVGFNGRGAQPLPTGGDGAGIADSQEEAAEDEGDGDWGHETFLIERSGSGFQFTKTAQKPYDVLVCACLLALADRAPSAWKITSDGGLAEWAPGFLLAKQALGRDLPLERIGRIAANEQGMAELRSWESPFMRARREGVELGQDVPESSARAASPSRGI